MSCTRVHSTLSTLIISFFFVIIQFLSVRYMFPSWFTVGFLLHWSAKISIRGTVNIYLSPLSILVTVNKLSKVALLLLFPHLASSCRLHCSPAMCRTHYTLVSLTCGVEVILEVSGCFFRVLCIHLPLFPTVECHLSSIMIFVHVLFATFLPPCKKYILCVHSLEFPIILCISHYSLFTTRSYIWWFVDI